MFVSKNCVLENLKNDNVEFLSKRQQQKVAEAKKDLVKERKENEVCKAKLCMATQKISSSNKYLDSNVATGALI